jgi:glutamine amidotransferase
MIAIIDYGMGNLHSVSKALERLGYTYEITDQADRIKAADGVILPGVGAFGDAMKQLKESQLIEVIKEVAQEKKPLLGICLGMQLLFTTSEENGYTEGLSLLSGHVKRLPGFYANARYKVPHMGWNRLQLQQAHHPVLKGIESGYTYFVHSYYVAEMSEDDLIAYAQYFERVPGIVGRDHILGMQFHPEKSSHTGMQLLRNFCRLCLPDNQAEDEGRPHSDKERQAVSKSITNQEVITVQQGKGEK